MGKLEEGSRSRTKKNQLKKIILKSIQVAGLLSIALLAPNVLGAMGKLGLIPSPRQNDVVRRTSDRLVHSGLLEWRDSRLRLTRRGEKELRLLTLKEYGSKRPRRWDRKWRLIIFDIPERRVALRRKIARVLRDIGFVRLQDSVWAYPYDCEDLIMLLKSDFRVGDDVRYMIVDMIERDESLRSQFKLK